ncbi:aspartyl-phosphate phosphatase Spo0E family protein [Bacillus weihaiensis]|uniref:Stage 0 sporulation protein n=1 Tax=Bacillus weihaiensis TaxID=1547283 RepID=A0A1L3MN58_9BACI|nr:aspartyl-phosphate phosphatase Spo0E family protein [Bacillus weihaiensis]APH03704.1 hypothetical protein A9C19_02425 [Bacillus weihaiensis]
MIEERVFQLIEESPIKKKNKKKLLRIGKQIAQKSSKMIHTASITGFTSKETIELSCEVDKLINKFHQKRSMYSYFKD